MRKLSQQVYLVTIDIVTEKENLVATSVITYFVVSDNIYYISLIYIFRDNNITTNVGIS